MRDFSEIACRRLSSLFPNRITNAVPQLLNKSWGIEVRGAITAFRLGGFSDRRWFKWAEASLPFSANHRMMRLPERLGLVFREEIKRFEEENQMPYISSIERIGRQEGRVEGRVEERHDIIRDLLVSRFGVLDEGLEAIIEPLSELSTAEFAGSLLPLSTLSREELLTRFGQNTVH